MLRPRAMHSHDSLVKKVFSNLENAAAELRTVLPATVCDRVDWTTLTLQPGSFVAEDARQWHTDLLFAVDVDGFDTRLYVLFEHQSSVDPWMPLRLLQYITSIWSAERDRGATQLPIVIPIVLHHSATGWTSTKELAGLFDAIPDSLSSFVPNFEMLVDDLVRVDERHLLERSMPPIARLTLWVLRVYGRGSLDPALAHEWLKLMEDALEALEPVLIYRRFRQSGGHWMCARAHLLMPRGMKPSLISKSERGARAQEANWGLGAARGLRRNRSVERDQEELETEP